jgi:hypothetical protein
MPKQIVLVCFLAAFSCLVFAQDEGGLIEGDGWAFFASAPSGWVRDGCSLHAQGIDALFCKAGDTFSPSTLHLYVCPTPRTKAKDEPDSLSAFMQDDEESFMASSPGVLVKTLDPYDPGMGYSFPLRDLDDTVDGYYQALAYYEGQGAFFVFVLACRSPEEREAARPALLELLSSFTYVDKEE